MNNRENIIKGLELCEIGSDDRCYETECPYYGQGCTESLKNDILELLKKQKKQKFLLDSDGKITPLPVVVRCKDCIWYDQRDGICEHHAVINNPSPDWYCADGERRTDDA